MVELQTLCKFIEKNLKIDIICPFHSLCGSSVLFVCKKDSSLQLCINYQDLNGITYKDCYLIPLVSDLLDMSKKAKIYMKIDLRSIYYLVHISLGEE